MDNSNIKDNFKCIEYLEKALHVWDSQNCPYSYQKVGWSQDENRFYLRGEDKTSLTSYVPGLFAVARGLSYLTYGQTTKDAANQMRVLADISITDLKALEQKLKNHEILREDIPRLISMLIQLKKTTECFAHGINIIKKGESQDQANRLDDSCQNLSKGIADEINELAKLILNHYVSVSFECAETGSRCELPYSICAGLHENNGTFSDQLEQTIDGEFRLETMKNPEEEDLAKRWLTGVVSADVREFSDLKINNPIKILKVNEFYALNDFAEKSPFIVLKKQCQEFARGNIDLMLADPDRFKSSLIASRLQETSFPTQSVLDFERVEENYNYIVSHYDKRLLELQTGKTVELDELKNETIKSIQLLKEIGCTIPNVIQSVLQEIIIRKNIPVSINLNEGEIAISYSAFLNFEKSNKNTGVPNDDVLIKVLNGGSFKIDFPSTDSDTVSVLKWLESPGLTSLENLYLIARYATFFSFKEKVDLFLCDHVKDILIKGKELKENTIDESEWLKYVKLAFSCNLPKLKENLRFCIPHIEFDEKNRETLIFFNMGKNVDKKLFYSLIELNREIKKVKSYIAGLSENERFELFRGNLGRKASDSAFRKFEVDSKKLQFLYDINNKDLVVKLSFLGRGAFKTVHKYLSINNLNFLAVGKQMFNLADANEVMKAKEFSKSEIQILNKLKGQPHILQLHSVSEEYYSRKKNADTKCIITEFCNHGELAHYLNVIGMPGSGRLTLKEMYQAACGILKGLIIVHEENIIHRDLKAENIFLKKIMNEGKEEIYSVIADFGMSCMEDNKELRGKIAGTPLFMAPEVLIHQELATKENDLWSLGVIFSLMFKHDWPYPFTDNLDRLIKSVVKVGEAPPPADKNSVDFVIWSLLRKNPKDRANLPTVLAFMEKKLEDLNTTA